MVRIVRRYSVWIVMVTAFKQIFSWPGSNNAKTDIHITLIKGWEDIVSLKLKSASTRSTLNCLYKTNGTLDYIFKNEYFLQGRHNHIIYPKYSDTLTLYHTCPNISTSKFLLFVDVSEKCWISGKQCRPWPDVAFCGVWSVYTVCSSLSVRVLRINTVKTKWFLIS